MSIKTIVVIGSGAAALALASALPPSYQVTVITKKAQKTAIQDMHRAELRRLMQKMTRLRLIWRIRYMQAADITIKTSYQTFYLMEKPSLRTFGE